MEKRGMSLISKEQVCFRFVFSYSEVRVEDEGEENVLTSLTGAELSSHMKYAALSTVTMTRKSS